MPLNLGRRILNDLVLNEVIALPVDKVAHYGLICCRSHFIMNTSSTKDTMTVSIHLTREEAEAYLAALDRATDNPFIQDDDECAPLFTLSGHLEGALYNTSTSN